MVDNETSQPHEPPLTFRCSHCGSTKFTGQIRGSEEVTYRKGYVESSVFDIEEVDCKRCCLCGKKMDTKALDEFCASWHRIHQANIT
jgi:hypothetical protein